VSWKPVAPAAVVMGVPVKVTGSAADDADDCDDDGAADFWATATVVPSRVV